MLWRPQQRKLGGFVISAWLMCSWRLNSLFKRRRPKDCGLRSAPEMETWKSLSLFSFHSANRFISYFRWNLRRGLMLNELHSCIYFARICIRTLYDFVGILPSQLLGFQSQDGTLRVSQVPRSSRSSAEECSNWQKQECNVAMLPWALKATTPPTHPKKNTEKNNVFVPVTIKCL